MPLRRSGSSVPMASDRPEHGRSAGLSLKTFMNACTVRRRISDCMKSENRKKNWQRRHLKMLWTTTEQQGAMAIISLQECMLMLDPTSASYTCGVSWGFM